MQAVYVKQMNWVFWLFFQIENEYYSTIRPKRVCPSGERPINILRSEGIEYLELRCVDLDPFSPIGIERSQIDFLDLLLLLCLIKESPSLDKEESAYLKENHRRVINYGRSPDLQIYFENKEVNAITLAKSLIRQMYEICQELGQFSSEIDHWIKSLKEQEEKIKNLELTPSGKLIKKITKEGLSHQYRNSLKAKLPCASPNRHACLKFPSIFHPR